MNGEPLAQAPRVVLRKLTEKYAKNNMKLMAGVEPEFHLINADGSAISDGRDTQDKPCYDQSAIMRRLDVIGEISTTMIQLGWGPYQNDHEDANGQFEINWNFNDALTTADQLAFFKFMVKSIAEKHGHARHLHAEALHQPHRQRLPCASFGMGQGGQEKPVRG